MEERLAAIHRELFHRHQGKVRALAKELGLPGSPARRDMKRDGI
ncbi:MAG TPA: hypothetical protein VFF73_13055 [Planctomycetota bacterium]|nr:hypothetical protein [Planctomycetota bacterium]